MSLPDPIALTVRSAPDLLAFLPYRIGYHPADSVLAVALTGTRITLIARADLPDTDDPSARDVADSLAVPAAATGATTAILIGYGTAARVIPMLDTTTEAFTDQGVTVAETLRVTDGRYFCDTCTAACCPPEGIPFDPTSNVLAARAVAAGHVALPNRAALAARLAPISGPHRDAMHQATIRAADRLAALLNRHAGTGTARTSTTHPATNTAATPQPTAGTVDEDLDRAGRAALSKAEHRYRDGGVLGDDDAGWLTVLLRHTPTRDHAWVHHTTAAHLPLWTDMTRRAEPDLVPAPATLLAFTAWRHGDGALAAIALDRALDTDPTYPMAQLLRDALQRGLPPSVLDGWPQPGAPSAEHS